MSNEQKTRVGDPELWIRLLYMIVFALLSGLARLLICAIALLQFLSVLVSGGDNRMLRDFSASLTEWVWLCFRFITFNSERKPFPFDDWPDATAHHDTGPASGRHDATAAALAPPSSRTDETTGSS